MTTRYSLDVVADRYGHYVLAEDYDTLEQELEKVIQELQTSQDNYSDLLDEFEDLKFRMDGLEK